MPLHITPDAMTGDLTPHSACRGDGGWEVSWLPGRTLDYSGAVTAMMLAETLAAGISERDRAWMHAGGWAGELGLSRDEAVAMAAEPPQDTAG